MSDTEGDRNRDTPQQDNAAMATQADSGAAPAPAPAASSINSSSTSSSPTPLSYASISSDTQPSSHPSASVVNSNSLPSHEDDHAASVSTPVSGSVSGSGSGSGLGLASSLGYRGYQHADPIVKPSKPEEQQQRDEGAGVKTEQMDTGDGGTEPSDTSTSSSLPSSASLSSPSGAPSRQYARKAIEAVGQRASSFLSSGSTPSKVMQLYVATANRIIPSQAKQLAMNQWTHYGDPLITKIDQRLDEALQAVEASRQAMGVAGNRSESNGGSTALLRSPSDHASSGPSALDESSDGESETDSDEKDSSEGGHLTVHHPSSEALYAMYWHQLKEKFMKSKWYQRVDEILLQNRVVQAFSARITRPAESFYQTVAEEYIAHADLDHFMAALKYRVGPAWDDRLAPLARAFYTTANAVSALVGAGKVVGGALQLGHVKVSDWGKKKVNTVIDQLIQRWEQVLGAGDECVDRWLPECEPHPALPAGDIESSDTALVPVESDEMPPLEQADGKERPYSYASAAATGASHQTQSSVAESSRPKKRNSSVLDSAPLDPTDADAALLADMHLSSPAAPNTVPISSTHPSHTSSALASKLSKRVRQRLPSLPSIRPSLVLGWHEHVRDSLKPAGWFNAVDDILMQNTFIQALAAIMQPAEHYYNSCVQVFQTRILKAEESRQKLRENEMQDDDQHANANGTHSDNGDASTVVNGSIHAPLSPSSSTSSASSSSSSSSVSSVSAPPLSVVEPSAPLVDDFVISLQRTLGASWDERLAQHARAFFSCAWNAVHKQAQHDQVAAAS